jgi:hypothetical protein
MTPNFLPNSRSDNRNTGYRFESTQRQVYNKYKNAVKPWKSEYLNHIHERYHRLIDEQLGRALAQPQGGKSSVRLPHLMPYNRAEAWLHSILRWMKLNYLGGSEQEPKRISILPHFLKGELETWFNDNVEGMSRSKQDWTFKEVISGIYDRFLHELSIQDVTERFYETRYDPKLGVLVFYNTLTMYAGKMIHLPDPYTFKLHVIDRLPKEMVRELFCNKISVEQSKMDNIIVGAMDFEETQRLQDHYHKKKASVYKKPTNYGAKSPHATGKQSAKTPEYKPQAVTYLSLPGAAQLVGCWCQQLFSILFRGGSNLQR